MTSAALRGVDKRRSSVLRLGVVPAFGWEFGGSTKYMFTHSARECQAALWVGRVTHPPQGILAAAGRWGPC